MAHTIPALMVDFERHQLRRHTPCHSSGREGIAEAMAEVHVELMLIHPFREGNGRIGRLLATLMALQAGLPATGFQRDGGKAQGRVFCGGTSGCGSQLSADDAALCGSHRSFFLTGQHEVGLDLIAMKRPVGASRLTRIPSMAEELSILRVKARSRLEASLRWGLVFRREFFINLRI